MRCKNEKKRIFEKISNDLNIQLKYEYFINDKNSKFGIVFYDAIIKNTNILLEYDGLGWHVVEGYEEHYIGHKFGISVQRAKRKDVRKNIIANKNNFTLLRIHGKMDYNNILELIRNSINEYDNLSS